MFNKKDLVVGMHLTCRVCPFFETSCDFGTSPIVFEHQGREYEAHRCKIVKIVESKVHILKPIDIKYTWDTDKGDRENIKELIVTFKLVPHARY